MALTNVFQADNIKNTSPNVVSPTFFCNFVSLGSTHDSTDCWNAHRSPAARESFKCVQGWVASAGWHREGGIDRVASAGWHREGGIGRVASTGWHRPGDPPQTKILATPVLSYKLLMKSPYSLHLLFLVFIDPLLYRSPLPSLPSLHLLQLLIYPIHPLLRFPFLLSFSSSYPHPLLFPYSPSRYPCPRCILRPLPILLLLCNVVMPDYHQSWLT